MKTFDAFMKKMLLENLEDWEYLLHHVEHDKKGEEVLHHCLIYDHLGNLYTIDHLKVKDKTYHIITGLEEKQDIAWSDEEAKEHKIKPKKMRSGMSFTEKSTEW